MRRKISDTKISIIKEEEEENMKYICSDYAIINCLAINKNIDNETKKNINKNVFRTNFKSPQYF